jgi:hypothetical protein
MSEPRFEGDDDVYVHDTVYPYPLRHAVVRSVTVLGDGTIVYQVEDEATGGRASVAESLVHTIEEVPVSTCDRCRLRTTAHSPDTRLR